MYDILEFLWSLPAYKPSIIKLSQQVYNVYNMYM